jgi:hypothetical protein
LPDICKESLKCGEPWDPGSVVETTYKHSFWAFWYIFPETKWVKVEKSGHPGLVALSF